MQIIRDFSIFYEDSKHNLWVVTTKGILVKPEKRKIFEYKISVNGYNWDWGRKKTELYGLVQENKVYIML